MQTTTPIEHPPSRGAIVAAALGLLTTLATGAACVGPFVAILLGVGGFGWLTRYAYLRMPASLLTFVILGYGFYRVYFRVECRHKRTTSARIARACLWAATAAAVAINVLEYLVLPAL